MPNIFLCSDHHFGHASPITIFKRDDGSPLRDFKDVTHMNEFMVMQHNRVVSPSDKVYFLGDVAMAKNAKTLDILLRMNGEKVLIKGNHDLAKSNEYLKYFKDIRGTHQLDGMLLSHVPIHPNSLSRWKVNVHGHLHYNRVTIGDTKVLDHRYFNVSMECLDDYTPISLEDLKKRVKNALES